MKKVLIAIIGSNNVYGIPLHNGLEKFDNCIKGLIDYGTIAMSKKTYELLPGKSPPFACHTTYIVSEDGLKIDPAWTKTFVIPSWPTLFEHLADDGTESLYIFLDNETYDEVLEKHKEDIDAIIVAQVNQAFKFNYQFALPSMFDWRSRIICEEKDSGHRSPGYVVYEYTKQYLHF